MGNRSYQKRDKAQLDASALKKGHVDFYPIVKAFFLEHSLVEAQIESFNRFLERGLQEVVDSFKEIELIENYKLRLGKIEVGPPEFEEFDGARTPLTPMECRLRKLTYWGPVYLEIKVIGHGMELKTERVKIGYIPIMVKSKRCRLYGLSDEELIEMGEDPADPGGYFIINGSERVVVVRDDLARNKVIVEETTAGSKPYSHAAYVISARAGMRSRLFLEYYPRDGTIKASFGAIRGVPVAVILKALGLEEDSQILQAISSDPEIANEFLYSLDEVRKKEPEGGFMTQEEALDYLGRRLIQSAPRQERINAARDYLRRALLPHVGQTEDDNIKKAYFIAKMVEKLLRVVKGQIEPDDKDHFSNKRLRLVGELMQEAFRYAFYRLVRELEEKANEQLTHGVYDLDIRRIVTTQSKITPRILRALATGTWPTGELGISQNLDRTNYIAALQHLRRVNSPLPPGLPLHEARQIHGTSVGRLCPLETPEGTNVGLVRSLATFADVTFGIDPAPLIALLPQLGVKPIEEATPEEVGSMAAVYVNGALVGLTNDPKRVAEEIKRRRIEISPEINIAYLEEERTVIVNADAGRVRRPLIPVERLEDAIRLLPEVEQGKVTFSDLVREGIVELLDPDEEEYALVAYSIDKLTSEHTHIDFAPYMMMGVAAGQIPYAEHNAIPRDIIGGNMVKQGLGYYATNWRLRMDSTSYLFYYPQRPIVRTKIAEITGYELRPSGQNLVVALLPMDGYNMDDALVMNKGAVDRGAGRAIFLRTYEAVARRLAIIEGDKFENPYDVKGVTGRRAEESYRKLTDDGIVEPEVNVEGGDVLIGRTSPPRFSPELAGGAAGLTMAFERRDTSIDMRAWERGVVTDVILATAESGEKMVRVRVRESRIPELGDKFATRHGQKGVIGMIYRQEDMPFTADGISPDIVLDPHAIPSRMTIGQLIEILAGKVGALEGRFVDGTPFAKEPVEDLMEALKRLGFEYTGEEIMYDGRTGRMLRAPVFIGISFYQRLKHMVRDKIHARARGQVQILTRQPVEGRARGGGLRLGEMEGEVLISHGAAAMLRDRYIEHSDKTIVYVCKRCGSLAFYNALTSQFYCPRCQDAVEVRPLITAHATRLLIQELNSGLIDVKLNVEEEV
ncbi:MAG TPA: DNA-directed RNA polymerase subunit B [Candidatus Korarchaeota archaeon]|nr:DNA-directed RNA polymerase subunit B [Candidatus Korarchaeota archaeon]